MSDRAIRRVAGPAIVLPGDDIDTDRIMPARFLRAITFDGIEAHIFEDDRRALAAAHGARHPFDDPARRNAKVLFVGANFGCGSSREHAPQAIARWGIRAVVGESFGEIFLGNAVAIGLPCVTVSKSDLARLKQAADAGGPAAEFVVELAERTVSGPNVLVPASLPDTARAALLSGQWDATSMLLDHYEDVDRVAVALPYLRNFND
jgi:3-isopropylmalate/(R)-2-methylmalate dehydratase small subunit